MFYSYLLTLTYRLKTPKLQPRRDLLPDLHMLPGHVYLEVLQVSVQLEATNIPPLPLISLGSQFQRT